MSNNLSVIINKFPEQRILVVGDLMIDRYLWSKVDRISPEAPVPVANIHDVTNVLGGAANTANNLSALGAHVDIVGHVGNDQDGELLTAMLADARVNSASVIKSTAAPTIVKTRIMCGTHQLIRFDREEIKKTDSRTEQAIIKDLGKNIGRYKVIVISDYAKGLVTETMAQKIIGLAKKNGVLVLSDPTPSTFYKFAGSYLVKPNRKEAELIVGKKIDDDFRALKNIGTEIKNKLGCQVLIITLGKDGMAIFAKDKMTKIDTCAKEVFDVSGAGDSTIAAIAVSLSSGADIEQSALIGNACAGIVVGKLGTTTCSREELVDYFNNE